MIEQEKDTRKQFRYKIIFVLLCGDLALCVVHRRKLNPNLPVYNKVQKGFDKYYLALSRDKLSDREIFRKLIYMRVIKEDKKWDRMGDKRAIDFIAGKVKA